MHCLYCVSAGRSQEHVIPQAFGSFSGNTPTIHFVCQSCNSRLGGELDEHLARNTYEGLRRYQIGLLSGEPRVQRGLSLTMVEASNPDVGYLSGAPTWIDGSRAKVRFKAAVGLRRTGTEIFDWFTQEDLQACAAFDNYDRDPIHFNGIQPEQLYIYVELLNQRGFQIAMGEVRPLPSLSGGGTAVLHIEGDYSERTFRAFCKVVFHYAASQYGYTEVSSERWLNVRKYISTGAPIILRRVTDEPFWPLESKRFRFPPNSYNLRISNSNLGIIGAVQFFNIAKVEFLLCPDCGISSQSDARFTPGIEPLINPARIPGILLEHKNSVEITRTPQA